MVAAKNFIKLRLTTFFAVHAAHFLGLDYAFCVWRCNYLHCRGTIVKKPGNTGSCWSVSVNQQIEPVLPIVCDKRDKLGTNVAVIIKHAND